jgi:hypothetical protein
MNVEIAVRFLTRAIQLTGYSGSFVLGVGIPIMSIYLWSDDDPFSHRHYCLNSVSFTMRPRPFPTVSTAIEKWPHVAAFVVGVGVSNICLGALFTSLLYIDHPSPSTHNSNIFYRIFIGLMYYNQLVPIGSYVSMILMWGVLGTSLRGGVSWVGTIHDFIASALFVFSFVTIWSFILQRDKWHDNICKAGLIVCAVSITTCLLSTMFANTLKTRTMFALALENGTILGIAEVVYTTTFSSLSFYLFHASIVEKGTRSTQSRKSLSAAGFLSTP